jgi:ABC-2 type transport system permease protein
LADRPETASNLPMPLMLLPLIGSGFVPTASMPPGVRQFAEYQPFTPVTQTVRGLLTGTPIGATPSTPEVPAGTQAHSCLESMFEI